MRLIPGEAPGNLAEADGCKLKGSPIAGHSVVLLNTRLELVYLY
jgi:hypothetical protein